MEKNDVSREKGDKFANACVSLDFGLTCGKSLWKQISYQMEPGIGFNLPLRLGKVITI